MNTIVVWYLVTIGGYNGNQVIYSPPMQDLATCNFLKKSTEEMYPSDGSRLRARCIQIKTVVKE